MRGIPPPQLVARPRPCRRRNGGGARPSLGVRQPWRGNNLPDLGHAGGTRGAAGSTPAKPACPRGASCSSRRQSRRIRTNKEPPQPSGRRRGRPSAAPCAPLGFYRVFLPLASGRKTLRLSDADDGSPPKARYAGHGSASFVTRRSRVSRAQSALDRRVARRCRQGRVLARALVSFGSPQPSPRRRPAAIRQPSGGGFGRLCRTAGALKRRASAASKASAPPAFFVPPAYACGVLPDHRRAPQKEMSFSPCPLPSPAPAGGRGSAWPAASAAAGTRDKVRRSSYLRRTKSSNPILPAAQPPTPRNPHPRTHQNAFLFCCVRNAKNKKTRTHQNQRFVVVRGTAERCATTTLPSTPKKW